MADKKVAQLCSLWQTKLNEHQTITNYKVTVLSEMVQNGPFTIEKGQFQFQP